MKNIFCNLISKYTDEYDIIDDFWNEILTNYSQPNRLYHNLYHIEFLIDQLQDCKEYISDWDTILFSAFYHDIIYSAMSNENEEKSTELAKERLSLINYPANRINKCVRQILATQKHQSTGDIDTDLFTDADLSILGQSWDVYFAYTQKIRAEYQMYDDSIYTKGRIGVLKHFLDMNFVYKTQLFREKLEEQARYNILRELDMLSHQI